MVLDQPKYAPIAKDTLEMVLRQYNVDRVVVGHTIFDDISSFHSGRVIAVNVDNKKNRENHKSRAILIEDDRIYIIYDDPARKHPLP